MTPGERYETKRQNFITKTYAHFAFLTTEFGYDSPVHTEGKQDNGAIIWDEIAYTNSAANRVIHITNAYHPVDYGFTIEFTDPSRPTHHADRETVQVVMKEDQDQEQSYLEQAAKELRTELEVQIKGNSASEPAAIFESLVKGRTLTNLYFTKQDGPHDHLPGIAPAYYFSTVMELDGATRVWFSNDRIEPWEDAAELIELTHENWELPPDLCFKGSRMVALTVDEDGQMTFHLENGVTIQHTVNYGDKLFIQNAERQTETAKDQIELPKRKWWQRDRVTATDIPTKDWKRIIAGLTGKGWATSEKYDGFDAGIDFDFCIMTKGCEQILFGWDNWNEGEIRCSSKRMRMIGVQFGIEFHFGEPSSLKPSVIAITRGQGMFNSLFRLIGRPFINIK